MDIGSSLLPCWGLYNQHTSSTSHLSCEQIVRLWTLCLMHMCVISIMFGSCFSFLRKLLSFLFFIFMCFLLLLLLFMIKIKCFFCTFVFLFIWMQVWSFEKEDTPHSFPSRDFLYYYKFIFSYFLLFIWFVLFCNFFSFKIILLYFPFLVSFVSIPF